MPWFMFVLERLCLLFSCRSLATIVAAASILLLGLAVPADAEEPGQKEQPTDYRAVDDLKFVLIDSSDTESFLSHRHDTEGRLFVGGREALFVYEPIANNPGGPLYGERQLLYRFPNHTWVYDIAIRGDDIYVLTMSALYVIPDARVKREGLKPKRLLYGIPQGHVHQCFHGLAWGPEGDLYLSTGDPTWYMLDAERPDHWGYWTYFSQPEGTKTIWNGVGGAFRMRPDGTRFQVVATGLRNSCGLAFDEHFNLFTNDNDHEGNPVGYVPGRLLHLSPGSDMVWPRGWMMFKTPERRDIVRTMFDGMGRGVPVGQTYYNESRLPERFRHNLLVARWGARKVTRYPLLERGATFRTRELDVLVGEKLARPVGVSVGRDGRMFATISYMKHNEGSPTYKSDLVMITGVKDEAPYHFEAYNAVAASVDQLFDELQSPSWWRRYRAHVELQRRGGPLLEEATARLRATKSNSPQAIHLLHLAAASKNPQAAKTVAALAKSKRPALRLQAYRTAAEYPQLGATRATFVEGLSDRNPRVRLAALEGLARFDSVPEEVVAGPAQSDDTYLRQAAIRLLSEKAPLARLEELCMSDQSSERLAGVLAVGRRLTVRDTDAVLPEEVPLGKTVGPVVNLNGEQVDLRTLGRIGTYRIKDVWKHVPHSDEQETMFTLLIARLDDADEIVRLQAATFLNLLDDERSNPLVTAVRGSSERTQLAQQPWQRVAEVAVIGPFPNRAVPGSGELFGPGFDLQRRSVDLAARHDSGRGQVSWRNLKRAGEGNSPWQAVLPEESQETAYLYFHLQSGQKQRVELKLGSGARVKLWQNGSVVWTTPIWYARSNANDRPQLKRIAEMQSALPLELQPGNNTILLRMVRSRADGLPLDLSVRSLLPVVASVPSAEQQSLSARLQAASGEEIALPAVFFEYDWVGTVKDGDPLRGRQLFESIGCNKCHATRSDVPVSGGPSLADSRGRFSTEYLAESVLVPSRQVSPLFRATLITTHDGRQLRGLVIREDAADDVDGKLELLKGDATRVVIPLAEIEERQTLKTSPMPAGLVKSPEELRDILAYLLAEGM